MAIVEIVVAPSSEAYRTQGPAVLKNAAEQAVSAGALGVYVGIEEEDEKTLLLVLVWDKVEDYQALASNSTLHSQLMEAIGPALSGPPCGKHLIQFEPSPAAALNAPYTAFTHITIKEGKQGADFDAFARPAVNASVDKYGATLGKVLDKNEYMFASGWDKVEDHVKLGAESDFFKAFATQAADYVAKHKDIHVALKPWKKFE